jgi:hypothetical protein
MMDTPVPMKIGAALFSRLRREDERGALGALNKGCNGSLMNVDNLTIRQFDNFSI